MPVDSTHPMYDEFLPKWSRARDVIAGEDRVKEAGEAYLPRLDSQTDNEYLAYVQRASFFNATGRTSEGFQGMVFRRDPIIKLPEAGTPVGSVLERFNTDASMFGTSLYLYSKTIAEEILDVGRAGGRWLSGMTLNGDRSCVFTRLNKSSTGAWSESPRSRF